MVLQLLEWLLRAVKLLVCAISLPLCFFLKLTQTVVEPDGFYRSSMDEKRLPSYIFVLWIPRFVMSLCACAIGAGQVIGVCYLLDLVFIQVVWQLALIGVGHILLIIYGCLASQERLQLRLANYAKGMCWAVLDCGTFFVAMLVMVCLLRAVALMRIDPEKNIKWRRFVLKQAGLTCIDAFLLPVIAFLCVFPWRLPLIWGKWDTLSSGDFRILLLVQSLKLALDLPVFLVLCFLVIMPHRFFVAVRDIWTLRFSSKEHELSEHQADAACRVTVIVQVCLAALDPFVLLARIVVFLTVYRNSRLSNLLQSTTGGFFMRVPLSPVSHNRFSAHILVLEQFVSLLIDIPFILCGIFVVCTVWRASSFLKRLKELNSSDDGESKSSHCEHPGKQRLLALTELLNLFVDIPFLFLGLVVLALLYRAPNLIKRLQAESDISKRRGIFLSEFCSQLLDAPFIFLAIFSCFTFVRIYPLLRDLWLCPHASGRRKISVQQFCMAVLDVLCLFSLALITITGYRLGGLWRKLQDPGTIGFFAAWSENHKDSPYCCCELRETRYQSHQLVLQEVAELVTDLPFAPMLLVVLITGFRIPTLVSKWKAVPPGEYWALRCLCLIQAFNVLVDVMFMLLAGFVFVVGILSGRGFLLLRDIWALFTNKAPSQDGNYSASDIRWCILHHFAVLWLDYPALVCGLFIAVTIYRVSACKSDLTAKGFGCPIPYFSAMSSSVWQSLNPHFVLFKHAVSILIDIPFFFLGAIVAISGWRTLPLYYDFNFVVQRSDGSSIACRRRQAAVSHLFLLCLDILCLPLFLVTLLSGLRSKRLIERLKPLLPHYLPISSLQFAFGKMPEARRINK